MHHNCSVCFEYIFDTTTTISVLPCGHTMHLECVVQMEGYSKYSCPVCSRSICDMSLVWEKLDQETNQESLRTWGILAVEIDFLGLLVLERMICYNFVPTQNASGLMVLSLFGVLGLVALDVHLLDNAEPLLIWNPFKSRNQSSLDCSGAEPGVVVVPFYIMSWAAPCLGKLEGELGFGRAPSVFARSGTYWDSNLFPFTSSSGECLPQTALGGPEELQKVKFVRIQIVVLVGPCGLIHQASFTSCSPSFLNFGTRSAFSLAFFGFLFQGVCHVDALDLIWDLSRARLALDVHISWIIQNLVLKWNPFRWLALDVHLLDNPVPSLTWNPFRSSFPFSSSSGSCGFELELRLNTPVPVNPSGLGDSMMPPGSLNMFLLAVIIVVIKLDIELLNFVSADEALSAVLSRSMMLMFYDPMHKVVGDYGRLLMSKSCFNSSVWGTTTLACVQLQILSVERKEGGGVSILSLCAYGVPQRLNCGVAGPFSWCLLICDDTVL
ncbi:hypothetical protein HAX54_008129 [Datura stramonium]|uniref:RING-type domain-containing protein n=1 Tax=Datura stramonium TaxID=4076 RepID=A0ABS8TDQ6_DATST|nr:hypothetical protein [Datura stramonium]